MQKPIVHSYQILPNSLSPTSYLNSLQIDTDISFDTALDDENITDLDSFLPTVSKNSYRAKRLLGNPKRNWASTTNPQLDCEANILIYSHKDEDVQDYPPHMIEPREINRAHNIYNDDDEDDPKNRSPYPTTRRPWRRPLSKAPTSVIDEWFSKSQIEISPCEKQIIEDTKRLMYTYRDLNAVDIKDIPATDLFLHRVRLKNGVKPHREKRIIQQSDRQKFWLQKTIEEGLESGMYERVPIKNGKFSDWSAGARVVEKPGNALDMRVTFNYHYVYEDLPGTYMELISEIHDYLSLPQHQCFIQMDIKHAYCHELIKSPD